MTAYLDAADPFDETAAFEVRTAAADALGAHLVVRGRLTDGTGALLRGVLECHLAIGRLALRVDLADAECCAPAAIAFLAGLKRDIGAAGGRVIFEPATA